MVDGIRRVVGEDKVRDRAGDHIDGAPQQDLEVRISWLHLNLLVDDAGQGNLLHLDLETPKVSGTT